LNIFNLIVSTLSKGRNFTKKLVRHCCQNGNNVEATFDIVEIIGTFLGKKVECCIEKVERCFDIVVGVDTALG